MTKKSQLDSKKKEFSKEELKKLRLKEKVERERRKAQQRSQLTLFRS